jgi:hypothetical protein
MYSRAASQWTQTCIPTVANNQIGLNSGLIHLHNIMEDWKAKNQSKDRLTKGNICKIEDVATLDPIQFQHSLAMKSAMPSQMVHPASCWQQKLQGVKIGKGVVNLFLFGFLHFKHQICK